VQPKLKIVSGGQTGVDRAALDAALACGLPVGGWCPSGRRAEDGVIPARYPLIETASHKYPQRTAWNVRDSDITLILTLRELDSGSRLTAQIAQRLGKPYVVASLNAPPETIRLPELLPFTLDQIVLNIAGPRESRCPGIYARAFGFLVTFLRGHRGAARRVKNLPAAALHTSGSAWGRTVNEPAPPIPRAMC
jgi:hypothetical protein